MSFSCEGSRGTGGGVGWSDTWEGTSKCGTGIKGADNDRESYGSADVVSGEPQYGVISSMLTIRMMLISCSSSSSYALALNFLMIL